MEDETRLKEQINSFVWENGPGSMTLDQAEELALKIFRLFLDAREFVHGASLPLRENSP